MPYYAKPNLQQLLQSIMYQITPGQETVMLSCLIASTSHDLIWAFMSVVIHINAGQSVVFFLISWYRFSIQSLVRIGGERISAEIDLRHQCKSLIRDKYEDDDDRSQRFSFLSTPKQILIVLLCFKTLRSMKMWLVIDNNLDLF